MYIYIYIYIYIYLYLCLNSCLNSFKLWVGLHRWLSAEESTCQTGDTGSVPGSERPPGEGNDNPLQFSSMGNPIDREAWWVTVHGIIENRDNLVNKQQQ